MAYLVLEWTITGTQVHGPFPSYLSAHHWIDDQDRNANFAIIEVQGYVLIRSEE